jgi:hypothetical protein
MARKTAKAKRLTKREGKRRAGGKAARRGSTLITKMVKVAVKERNTAAVARSRAKGTKRRDRDAYLTIQSSADAIVWRLRYIIGPVTKVLEPSAGTGNLVRAAKEVWPQARILAVDLYDKHHRALLAAGVTSYITGDFLTQDVRGFDADVSLSNPPFSDAEAHVKHALAQLRDGAWHVALLPTTFLCAQRRARGLYGNVEPVLEDETTWPMNRRGEWAGLKFVMPLAERPSFTDDGKTDMVEYAIFIWQKGFQGLATLLPHCWRSDAVVLREYTRRAEEVRKRAEAEGRRLCVCGDTLAEHPPDGDAVYTACRLCACTKFVAADAPQEARQQHEHTWATCDVCHTRYTGPVCHGRHPGVPGAARPEAPVSVEPGDRAIWTNPATGETREVEVCREGNAPGTFNVEDPGNDVDDGVWVVNACDLHHVAGARVPVEVEGEVVAEVGGT